MIESLVSRKGIETKLVLVMFTLAKHIILLTQPINYIMTLHHRCLSMYFNRKGEQG